MSAEPPEAAPPDPRVDLIVQDFKCLRGEHRFECRGLTVLAGANCSGKSSAFQPLWLLKQTQQASYDPPGALKLDGPLVPFANATELLWCGAARGEFGVGLRTWDLTHPLGFRDGPPLFSDAETVSRLGVRDGDLTVERCEARQYWGAQAVRDDILGPVGDPSSVDNFLHRPIFAGNGLVSEHPYPQRGDDQVDSIVPHRFTLYAMRSFRNLTWTGDPWPGSAYQVLEEAIRVPGLRGNPDRRFPLAAATSKPSGLFAREYTAGFLLAWQQIEDQRLAKIGAQLEAMGLTSRVEVSNPDGVSVSLLVHRLSVGDGDMVNIADTGVGVSQVLPVLVALLAAEPGQIVHIEQPELHLHPEAQARLAAVLIEAAARGVLVVIETHSPLLLLALQTSLAAGDLPPEKTRLYWFERDADGAAIVTPGQLDEHGRYHQWPVDFGDVERRRNMEFVGKSLGMSTEA